MNSNIDILHIMPGLLCNFQCTHCVNDSGPARSEKMSIEEIEKVIFEIKKTAPRRLVFTGGEPTLHLDIINRLILAHPNVDRLEVFVTTNGWYSKSESSIACVLDKFIKITHLQLSYDIYHGTKISIGDIRRLRDEVNRRSIEFNISVCMSSPQELLAAHELQKELGELVIFQRVEAVGRAEKNNVHFKYPEFEPESLEKKCPNLGQMSYIVNKGFSVCCSNLAFNSKIPKDVFHSSVEGHLNSDFYKALEANTFGELLEKRGIAVENLSAEFSSPCRLCELVHKGS